ncbi:hypothetical protein HDU96_002539 [Phlyctochytrium bullatum]|nr:hypothetical protein HDU96_002539 [Phlyctochytrium bullatum]
MSTDAFAELNNSTMPRKKKMAFFVDFLENHDAGSPAKKGEDSLPATVAHPMLVIPGDLNNTDTDSATGNLGSTALPEIFVPTTTFGQVTVSGLTGSFVGGTPEDTAKNLIALVTGTTADNVNVSSSSISDGTGVKHVYLQLSRNNVPIVNVVANVNLDRSDNVITAAAPEVDLSKASVKPSACTLPAVDVVLVAANALGYDISRLKTRVRRRNEDHWRSLCLGADNGYQKVIPTTIWRSGPGLGHGAAHQLNLFVSTTTGALLGANNWMHKGAPAPPPPLPSNRPQFRAIPLNKENLLSGTELFINPSDPAVSRLNWVGSPNSAGEHRTSGNNAIVTKGGVVVTFSRSQGVFD